VGEGDLMAGAHRQPAFLALTPFGQVPVLEDEDVVIADSNAILVYLAKKAGRSDWLPEDAQGAAAVQRWLSVAAGELAYGPAAARLVTVFGASFNAEEVIKRAHVLLDRMEQHLGQRTWLAADHPTIADVAVYSYLARAPEGNVDLSGYPVVTAFLARIEALPGFVPFIQTPAGLTAKA
jgi:glutathione S-transferase